MDKLKKIKLGSIVLLIGVVLTASYFVKVYLNKPISENISLPEVKIVNTTVQLDKETNKKINNLCLLLESQKVKNDSLTRLKVKNALIEFDSIFYDKSKVLNKIAKNNVDSIVKILNKKIDEVNNIQNNIRTVKEDYEYRTDLYQSLILFIAAIIGFFGYSNFKDIEVKSKEIAEKRVNKYTDERITEIVTIKAEEHVKSSILDVTETEFEKLRKKFEIQLNDLLENKIKRDNAIESDQITNLKSEIKELKRRISELEG